VIYRDDILRGRVALVTGGGTGLGLAIASSLASCGADIAVASRRPKHYKAAAERLRSLGVKALPVEVNVREPEAARAMVERVEGELGRLDILVNNAAGNFYCPSAELSANGWRAVVETDLYGTFFCAQAAYPAMKRQGGGRIISISMTLHYAGWPLMAHATAAKAGIDALTKTLAKEWAPDAITVNAIAPGPIPTEGATAAFAKGGRGTIAFDEAMRTAIPLGRWGSGEDIGSMAVYLASEAGSWITGAIFVVDGGSSLQRS